MYRQIAVLGVELEEIAEEITIICEVDTDADRVIDQWRVNVAGAAQPAYFLNRTEAFVAMARLAADLTREREEVIENAKR